MPSRAAALLLARRQQLQLKRCVCAVAGAPDELFSVCRLPCRVTYHKHWWVRAQRAADGRLRGAEERA